MTATLPAIIGIVIILDPQTGKKVTINGTGRRTP